MRLPLQALFEARSFSLRDPALARLWAGSTADTAAGIAVTEDSALNLSAYWRGVQLIGGQVAAMPLHLYKGDKEGAKEKFKTSKLYKLLHDRPNPEMTAYSFREALQAHLLTWGNAYAEIEWNNAGQPINLWPITPDRVTVYRDRDRQIRYRVAPSGASIAAEDMLHVPGLGFDGLIGYSVIARARQSLGMTSAAERYGATFFGNGTAFGGLLSTPNDLDETQRKELRQDIESMHKGPDRAHRFMLLYNGLKYDRLAVPPEDAQFLETRKFQIIEMARWLGVPPHKLYELDRATFSNIEQQGIEYYTDTIWMWLEKWEQELNRKLIPNLEGNYQFFEFDFNGVVRADMAARFSSYQIGRQGGWYSINDIKRKENEPPLGPEGDIYLAPLNMIPLDKFREYIDNKLAPKPQSAALPPPPADPAADPQVQQLQRRLEETLERAARADASLQEARADVESRTAELAASRAEDTVHLEADRERQRVLEEARQTVELITGERNELQREATRLQTLYDTEQTIRAEQQRQAEAAIAERTVTSQQLEAERIDHRTERQRLIEEARETAELIAEERNELQRGAARLQGMYDTEQVARAEQQRQAEMAIAERTATTQQLEAERTDRETERQRLATELEEARGHLATAEASLLEREETHREALTREGTERALLATAVEESRQAHLTATEDRARIDAALVAVRAEHEAAEIERERLRADLDEARSALAVEEEGRAMTEGVLADFETARTVLQQQLASETAAAESLRMSEQELLAARDAAVTASAEATVRVDALTAEHDATVTALQVAEAARDVALAAQREAQTALEQAQTARAVDHDRVGAVLESHRALLVDVMRRMIEREVERAQRSGHAPDKLTAWVETFYAGHAKLVAAALEPALRVHLAWAGRLPELPAVTQSLVEEHVAISKRELLAVTTGEGEFVGRLSELCERWTQARVHQVATQVVQREITRLASQGGQTPAPAPPARRTKRVYERDANGLIVSSTDVPIEEEV